jgi:hypothetical protein
MGGMMNNKKKSTRFKKKINSENKKIKSKNNIKKQERSIIEDKKPGVGIRAWFVQRNINKWEYLPRETYAKKHNIQKATLDEWDSFFKKY